MTDERLEAMIDEFEEIKDVIDMALEAKEAGDYARAHRLVHQYDLTVKDELDYWGIFYEWAVDDGLVVDTKKLF